MVLKTPRIPWTPLILGLFLPALVVPGVQADDADDFLLGKSYPLLVSVSHHAALFHWIDSLAGTSGGKTIPAHQKDFLSRFGNLTPSEIDLLQRFREARARDSARPLSGDREPRGFPHLQHIFLESEGMESALSRARSEMEENDFSVLREALDYFRPKYDAIWKDGSVVRRFLTRVRQDPGKKKLERLLSRMADAFEVDLSSVSSPRLVLVPVPSGHGTHATAIGSNLLVEVRSSDQLAEQASVIVHENAHFLFLNMNQEKRKSFELIVASTPSPAQEAWKFLHEALPTALGQGVADKKFRSGNWSQEMRWYHLDSVDAYAKAIYPLVRDRLQAKGKFDESFLKEALALFQGP